MPIAKDTDYVRQFRAQLDDTSIRSKTLAKLTNNYWFGRRDRDSFINQACLWVVQRIADMNEGHNTTVQVEQYDGTDFEDVPNFDMYDVSPAELQSMALSRILIDSALNLRDGDRSVVWSDVNDVKTHRHWHKSSNSMRTRLAVAVHDTLVHEAVQRLIQGGYLSYDHCGIGIFWTLHPGTRGPYAHVFRAAQRIRREGQRQSIRRNQGRNAQRRYAA